MKFFKVFSLIFILLISNIAFSGSKAELDAEIKVALDELYKFSPAAQELSKKAKGILVFPGIIKAGLVFGGAYGEGALIVGGNKVQYYNNLNFTCLRKMFIVKNSKLGLFK